MQLATDQVRWCASADEQPLLLWTADRAALGAVSTGRHLAPVTDVGRLPDGRLAVDVLRPVGTPLGAALDVIGALTAGVAVTLSVPLLELAVAERCGAVRIGTAGLDDVIVDDAGAIVLCDRPPGATARASFPAAAAAAATAPALASSAAAPTAPRRVRRSADPQAAGDGHRRSDQQGDRVLLLAARVVWERTDDRDPGRAGIDAALAEALDGDAESARTVLALVRAYAAPRPVRWDPPSASTLFGLAPPVAPVGDQGVVAVVRALVEHGVPLGGDRRLSVRHALVGLVVAVGVTAATVFALG